MRTRIWSCGLVLCALLPVSLWAQSALTLGTSTTDVDFLGTGSPTITMQFRDCSPCQMSGSANGSGSLFSLDGTFTISSPVQAPLTLTLVDRDTFLVNQTAPLNFSYSSSQGTLTGVITLYTMAQGAGSNVVVATGDMNITGGSFAAAAGGDEASVTLEFAVGGPLQALVNATGDITGQIEWPSVVVPGGGTECAPCNDWITGHAFLSLSNGDSGIIAVHAGVRDGNLWGNVYFSQSGLLMRSDSVTAYTKVDAFTRHIAGTASINGAGGYAYDLIVTERNGGHSSTFTLTLSNGFSVSGQVFRGVLKLHEGNCAKGYILNDYDHS